MYTLKYTRKAEKDFVKLRQENALLAKVHELIRIVRVNPFQNPPPYEKLIGDWSGAYSRRINIQHRLVYTVDKNEKVVVFHSAWSHYE